MSISSCGVRLPNIWITVSHGSSASTGRPIVSASAISRLSSPFRSALSCVNCCIAQGEKPISMARYQGRIREAMTAGTPRASIAALTSCHCGSLSLSGRVGPVGSMISVGSLSIAA